MLMASASSSKPRTTNYFDPPSYISPHVVDIPVIRLPASDATFEGFREWVLSEDFQNRGRISYINHTIYIDLSPEELETHNKVKTAISCAIGRLNEELDLGEFFSSGAWLTDEVSNLSTEPDATLVKWRSYKTGRVRLVPLKDWPGQYLESQGGPDWVLEIISDHTVEKDTIELRKAYYGALVSEYWLIDVRGDEIDFQLLVRGRKSFVAVKPKDGWYKSRVFGRLFRLKRRRNRAGRWQYKLEVKAN
jgi:Uma2 family endonuclease